VLRVLRMSGQLDLFMVPLEPGVRVQLHPATDAWMQGDRFGVVDHVGRFYVHVKMDRSGRMLRFTPEKLEVVQ